MTARCTFAHDHDLRSREVAEHAAGCEACAQVLALHARARQAWEWARRRDDATERSAREWRLKSVRGMQRARRGHVGWPLWIAAVATACVALWAFRASVRDAPPAGDGATAQRPMAPASPTKAAASTEAGSPEPRVGFRVVAVEGRASDASHNRLEVGRTLSSGDAIDVALGGSVNVGLLLDTASWIGISGPAAADVREEHSSALLVLHRGTARATSARGAVVETDTVRTHGENASWVVEVTADRTRVTATKGTIAVESTGSTERAREVSAGEAVAIDASGRLGEAAPAGDAAEVGRLSRAVERALDDGDRDAAESMLRRQVAQDRDGLRRARATLQLAELLLARGSTEDARGRLEPLALGRAPGADARLSADATWLYVRTFRTPRERAGAWARYLATAPSSSMKQIALVERARELADAGDEAAARAIVEGLGGETLAPVAADSLERVKARLERRDEGPTPVRDATGVPGGSR